MMKINVGIAFCRDVEVYQAVLAELIEHMIKKTDGGANAALASAIEINAHVYAGFMGFAGESCDTGSHTRL